MTIDYITAIAQGFPGVGVSCSGDPFNYVDIVWESGLPLPSKEALDAWITSNSSTTEIPKITVLAFRNRFTQQEKVAIDLASIDNPSADMSVRQLAATIRVMMADLASSTWVDLGRADTIAGVTNLETYGIIGSGRAQAILTTPPTPIEIAKLSTL